MAYVVKNILKADLEAEIPHMVVEANELEVFDMGQRINVELNPVEMMQPTGIKVDGLKSLRLDCIYDDEPLGFEKDLVASATKMHPQDSLEEVNLGDEIIKRPTYINTNINPSLRLEVIKLLHKFKDCFTRDYNEIPGLSRDSVELKLPI